MATLIFIILVLWLGLIGTLAVWTIFFQGYVYTEPVKDIIWRAPLAGSLLTLFYIFWLFIDYSSPGSFQTIFDAQWKVGLTPYPEFRIVNAEGKEEVYKKVRGDRGQPIYRKDGRLDGVLAPVRPQRVLVNDGDKQLIFEPDRDARGKFSAQQGQNLIYHEKTTSLIMQEGEIGVASVYRTAGWFANAILNLVHLLIWFLVLWFVLEYRWGHALGLAIVIWIAATLFLLPPTLSRVESLAPPRTASAI